MSSFCSLHRLPRAGVDPIDSEPDARALLDLLITAPLRSETIVLLLDHERRGLGVLMVGGTVPFDAVFDVLDLILSFERDDIGSVIVASVRPPTDGVHDLDERDIDRWIECSAMLEDAGIELVEWFVVGHDVQCPRDLLGEPPRW